MGVKGVETYKRKGERKDGLPGNWENRRTLLQYFLTEKASRDGGWMGAIGGKRYDMWEVLTP